MVENVYQKNLQSAPYQMAFWNFSCHPLNLSIPQKLSLKINTNKNNNNNDDDDDRTISAY